MASVRKVYWYVDRKTRKKLRFSESENPNAVRVESEYWTACYTDADGKRRQVSTGETVESKALAKAIDLMIINH